MQSTFRVEGMHCQGCANTVSAALRGIDTVTAVEVDLATSGPSLVRLQAARPVSVAEVSAALRDDEEFSVLPD